VNLVHWAPQHPTPRRRDELRGHAVRLIQNRAIDLSPVRGIVGTRPYVLQRTGGGGVGVMLNTARLHQGWR
jgi:hypothetical protein